MTTSSPALEARVAHIEGIIEELRSRIQTIETRLDRLDDRLQTQFQWRIGIMLPMWLTIILAVVLKG
jgi:hypothetical protein